MKHIEYLIKTHSAKQREMLFDTLFALGLPWQKGYNNDRNISIGDDVERQFPFSTNRYNGIVLHGNGYVAVGTCNHGAYVNYTILDATLDFATILVLMSKIATNHKNEFKPINVPLNEKYSATIVNKLGRVMVGCQEFEASMILNLAEQIKQVITS